MSHINSEKQECPKIRVINVCKNFVYGGSASLESMAISKRIEVELLAMNSEQCLLNGVHNSSHFL